MDELNKGLPMSHGFAANPHNIANVLKRWFKELPLRLFALVPDETVDDELATVKVGDCLPDNYRSLFLWLLRIMVDTARYSDSNKMDSKNLALVWGPTLGGANDDPAGSLLSVLDFSR
jgi:hypothetical protein